jgi:hexosaminidase
MWLGVVSRRWLLRTGSVMPVEGIDVQVFPRLTALAEVGWSPKDARNWDDFRSRLVIHAERLQRQGVQVTHDASVWEQAPSQ